MIKQNSQNKPKINEDSKVLACEKNKNHEKNSNGGNLRKDRYETLVENLPIGVYYGDFVGNVFYANKKACEITGYKKEDLPKLNLLKSGLIQKKDIPRAIKLYALKSLGKATGPEEFEIVRKDKTKIFIEYYSRTMVIDGKRRVIGMFQDITYKKEAQKIKEESEMKYQMIIENAPFGIYQCTYSGKFLYGNKKAEEMIGRKREQVIGKNLAETGILSPKYVLKAMKQLARIKSGEYSQGEDYELIHKDGSKKWIRIYSGKITIDGKEVVMGITEDISQRKKIEIELHEKMKELERMNKIMIGREIKMIEMKEEIEKLKDEIKKLRSNEN